MFSSSVWTSFVVRRLMFFVSSLLSVQKPLSLAPLEELIYHMYFFALERLGKCMEIECIQTHLKVIKATYEAMIRSQIPVTLTYFLEHHVGNQLHTSPLERPYIAVIRQRKLKNGKTKMTRWEVLLERQVVLLENRSFQ